MRKISRDVLAKSPISSDSWCLCKSELIWIKVNDNWVLSGTSWEPVGRVFRVIFFVPIAYDGPCPCLFLHPKAIFISLCLILLIGFLSVVTKVSGSWAWFILRDLDGSFLPDAQLAFVRIPADCWARLGLWDRGQNRVLVCFLEALSFSHTFFPRML